MWANTVEFYRVFARCSRHGWVVERDGVVMLSTGIPAPDFNLAYLLPSPRDPARAVAVAVEHFAPSGLPWTLMALEPHDSTAVDAVAAAAGLRRNHPWPGMVLTPESGHPPTAPANLSISTVESETTWHTFLTTLAHGYGVPAHLLELIDTPAWLTMPDLTPYLAWLDGQPVGTAMRFFSHGIGGIQAVSTLPEQRGKGIGAALTWHAAHDTQGMHQIASALQSSALGFNVYQRIGYRHVLDAPTWTPVG